MDTPRKPDNDNDLIERLVSMASFVGLSPVKARWKLLAWQRKWQDLKRKRELKAEHLAYAHHICPTCGGLVDKSAQVCPKCGGKRHSRAGEFLRRLGFSTMAPTRATFLLGFVILVAYVRVIVASPGEGLLSFSVKSLILNGGNHPASVFAGQYWRLFTALFLHAGVWHLGFNLMALAQVGPMVADVFGAGRMVFYFLLTGVSANLCSVYFGHYAVQVGASGAIMGLVGIAAGWGTRDKTSIGKNVRGQMVRWALYTMMFGFFMGADNIAHGTGFAIGGVLGYVAKPSWLRAQGKSLVLGTLSTAVVLACLALIIAAPAPVLPMAKPRPVSGFK